MPHQLSMANELLATLIVDTNPDARMRVKQATASVTCFSPVQLCATLKEATGRLSEGHSWDLVFLSSRFSQAELAEFVRQGKGSALGADAAYVMVVPPRDQDMAALAGSVLMGIDGLLCEPYSVDGLLEISRLAAVIKKERVKTRQEGMVASLIKNCGDTLDSLALATYLGRPAGEAKRGLRELAETLRTLSPELMDFYFATLAEQWEKRTAPHKPELPKSKRVQEKMKKQREADKGTGSGYRLVRG